MTNVSSFTVRAAAMLLYGVVKAAETFLGSTNALGVDSRDPNMTQLIARIRILPSDADSDLEGIIKTLSRSPPNGIVMKQHIKEPIAFGLYAIIADFILDDAEGEMDRLEESIKSVAGVGEIEALFMSRQSVSIK
jgi:elongation factor 1-beta